MRKFLLLTLTVCFCFLPAAALAGGSSNLAGGSSSNNFFNIYLPSTCRMTLHLLDSNANVIETVFNGSGNDIYANPVVSLNIGDLYNRGVYGFSYVIEFCGGIKYGSLGNGYSLKSDRNTYMLDQFEHYTSAIEFSTVLLHRKSMYVLGIDGFTEPAPTPYVNPNPPVTTSPGDVAGLINETSSFSGFFSFIYDTVLPWLSPVLIVMIAFGVYKIILKG